MKIFILLLSLACCAWADQPPAEKVFKLIPGDYMLIENPYPGKKEAATARKCRITRTEAGHLLMGFQYDGDTVFTVKIEENDRNFTFSVQQPGFDGKSIVSDIYKFSLMSISPINRGYVGEYILLSDGAPEMAIPARLILIAAKQKTE